VKVQHTMNDVEIHYIRQMIMGAVDDVTFMS
jgi:hypothetical protein